MYDLISAERQFTASESMELDDSITVHAPPPNENVGGCEGGDSTYSEAMDDDNAVDEDEEENDEDQKMDIGD